MLTCPPRPHPEFTRDTNTQEQLNGKFADRFIYVCGVRRDDSPIFFIVLLHRKFIKPHGGISDRAPAEAAGIKVR